MNALHLREGRESYPSLGAQRETQRIFNTFALSRSVSHPGQYWPSITEHFRVPAPERFGAWDAALELAQQNPLPADLERAHPRRY